MIKKFAIFINLLICCITIASGFSSLIDPAQYWQPAFLGLLFPFLVIFHFIIIIIWFLFKEKKMMLFSIITLAIVHQSLADTLTISSSSSGLNQYSIMTWNVKNFDLYNWSNNENAREEMFQLIEDADPDFLCLQEFYNEDVGTFKNIEDLGSRLGYNDYFFGETYSLQNNNRWGLIIFSKYPIIGQEKITFETTSKLNACIYTDVLVEKDTVRIYNTHLQSLHFGEEDYEYLQEGEPNIEASKKIVYKLKNGFENRSVQVQQLREHMDTFSGKKIFCGDFNDTPVSFAYRTLSENMQDAFCAKGWGFGNTYVNPTPFFRIDYTLFDKSFSVNRHEIFREEYSDHYPSQTFFSF